MNIEQQREYILDLREMWRKVARIHGTQSPQERKMFEILCGESDKLYEMRKKAKSDADWQGFAKYLEWIEEGRDDA